MNIQPWYGFGRSWLTYPKPSPVVKSAHDTVSWVWTNILCCFLVETKFLLFLTSACTSSEGCAQIHLETRDLRSIPKSDRCMRPLGTCRGELWVHWHTRHHHPHSRTPLGSVHGTSTSPSESSPFQPGLHGATRAGFSRSTNASILTLIQLPTLASKWKLLSASCSDRGSQLQPHPLAHLFILLSKRSLPTKTMAKHRPFVPWWCCNVLLLIIWTHGGPSGLPLARTAPNTCIYPTHWSFPVYSAFRAGLASHILQKVFLEPALLKLVWCLPSEAHGPLRETSLSP